MPLIMSTSLTVLLYYLFMYVLKVDSSVFSYFSVLDQATFYGDVDKERFIIVCHILVMARAAHDNVVLPCVKSNIFSSDSEIFLLPHYDPVFFEQQFIFNRQTKKKDIYRNLLKVMHAWK